MPNSEWAGLLKMNHNVGAVCASYTDIKSCTHFTICMPGPGVQLSIGTGGDMSPPHILKLHSCPSSFIIALLYKTWLQCALGPCGRLFSSFRLLDSGQHGHHRAEGVDRLCKGNASERIHYRTSTGEMNRVLSV